MRVNAYTRRRAFRPEDVSALMTELREIEERLDAFARRVKAANLRRPGGNAFYSSASLSMIGVPDGWLRRVKNLLEEEACVSHPPKAEATTTEARP